MKRLWRTFKAVRRMLRYADSIPEWTEQDSRTMDQFLDSATGTKLKNATVTHILNSGQTALEQGGNNFECGVVTGMRIIWVFIEGLRSAGVAPEADQDYD